MRKSGTGRLGGLLLATGGVGFFLAGMLHPQPGSDARGFHDAMASMLAHSFWPAAHWIALVTGMILAWAVWLLADDGWADGSTTARAGAPLAILATLFMTVQWAVEIAARGDLEAYITNQGAAVMVLIDAMQAIGWPALGLGFGMLAIGVTASAPRLVRALGMTGAAGVGLAGLLAQGLHLLEAGPLFMAGSLLALWMVWAGVRAARHGGAHRGGSLAARPATPAAVATTLPE